ncbi:site-specific integrase [Amycolatopsis taiwanensis]|uniref:site-specific integrase n=1 Tax=Amycolatopsis taiwanensis TaxID=342230 RepID=UPI00048485E4|nr:tyrosine-type recombinase/integrase [Amycolatopsis taiwanensis]
MGTWGEIHVKQISEEPAVWEAHARFRMKNGRSKQVRRRGASKTKATNNLKVRLTELANEITSGEITPSTRFAVICERCMDDLARAYRLAGKSPSTPRLYRGYVNNWIKPALGELQAREVRAWGCNELIQRGRDKSYDTAKSLRAALSLCCAYAVRYGAMEVNPVKSTERLERGTAKEIQALTLDQRIELRAKLVELGEAKQSDAKGRRLGRRARVWLDLPDIMDAMLATGVRLGELLALADSEIDPNAPTVLIGHHLVRETGAGLQRLAYRKGNGNGLLLAVPNWSVPMWRRRKVAAAPGGPIFPSWNDQWSDPSNVGGRMREAFDACGFEWVTSHVWRKTVATVLDEAGLPTTAIADQLGNSPQVVERHYRRKRVANQATAEVLEMIFGNAEGEG